MRNKENVCATRKEVVQMSNFAKIFQFIFRIQDDIYAKHCGSKLCCLKLREPRMNVTKK